MNDFHARLKAGIGQHRAGKLQAAGAIYRRILDQNPNHFDCLNLLAAVELAENKPKSAIELLHRAIAIQPDHPGTHAAFGNAFTQLNRLDEALASYDRALQLKPDLVEAVYNRAWVLQHLYRHADALAGYEKAVSLKPDHADAQLNRGNLLAHFQRHGEALAAYERTLELAPARPWLPGICLHTRMQLCDWCTWDDSLDKIAMAISRRESAITPFASLPLPLSRMSQKSVAEEYVNERFTKSGSASTNQAPFAGRRIRIAYFSADFHEHPMAHLMAGLFENHDHDRFEVIAFSYGTPAKDATRKRLEAAFDRFFDVHGKTDDEIVALARRTDIDIAIDRKGHTTDNRFGLFARRLAPVQVSYLGYPGTTGADFMDYLIADPTIIPDSHFPDYTEKIVRLPDSYQVNDRERPLPLGESSRVDHGLPEYAFIFCSFNNNYKITPDQFDIWMRIIRQMEGSFLWIYVSNATAVDNLRREAEARGVDPDRLLFAEKTDHRQHLARLPLADLFLDTFHCNAHTTASDALWMGLPVLTRMGETFAGRVATSLLQAVGLHELATGTDEEYETLALELARDPDRLQALRTHLESVRFTCPLFDTERTTRKLEAAYEAMWQRRRDGLSLDHIDIS